MKNLDSTRQSLREMAQALEKNDKAAFLEGFEKMGNAIEDIRADCDQKLADAEATSNAAIMAQRGIRQLTSEEREYYQAWMDSMKAKDPKQALDNLDKILPETVINSVFEDLRTSHPLLSKLNFRVTNAQIKLLVNTNGRDKAVWGELCDEIVKEAMGGFVVINTGLLKVSAFIPVCKSALELGPVWLDRFVRETLYEYFANGLEDGILNGDGNDAPIGMRRQYGEGVVVVDGAYPLKEAITVPDLSIGTVGNLVNTISTIRGVNRAVRNLMLIVSPSDYYTKVVPAMMIMAPDGSYRNALPFNIEVIQSAYVPAGEAVFGMADRYFAAIGSSREGRVEYSDHARYLLDQRVYIIKGFATGMPLDGNSFLRLDISDVAPMTYKVTAIDARTPSADATLTSLKIGNKALSPAFSADTTTYTAATTDATNTILVQAADANATVEIKNGNTVVANGAAATWASGSNTLTVKVTAENGSTNKTYTVTVTKS